MRLFSTFVCVLFQPMLYENIVSETIQHLCLCLVSAHAENIVSETIQHLCLCLFQPMLYENHIQHTNKGE